MAGGRTFAAWRRLAAGAIVTGWLVLVTGAGAGAASCTTALAACTAPATPVPPATPTTTVPQPSSAAAQARLVALVNAERTQRGLTALQVRGDVTAIASGWSDSMARAATLSHNDAYFTDASHRRLGAQLLGENVARAGNIDVAHRALMASDRHRANILDARFDAVGIGATFVDGTWWITEDFLQAAAARPVPHVARAARASAPRPVAVTSTSTTSTTSSSTTTIAAAVVAVAPASPVIVAVLPRVDRTPVAAPVAGDPAPDPRRAPAVVGAGLVLLLLCSLASQLRRR